MLTPIKRLDTAPRTGIGDIPQIIPVEESPDRSLEMLGCAIVFLSFAAGLATGLLIYNLI